ncbi:uncharacterized protein METZ01_LOCUS414678, partial [marine metagenome]
MTPPGSSPAGDELVDPEFEGHVTVELTQRTGLEVGWALRIRL